MPGYGLAVAAAQYDIAELVKTLRAKGVDVKCAAPLLHIGSILIMLSDCKL